MATLISRVTGALTAASFAAIATGTGASQFTATTAGSITTGTVTSSTFDITNGEVVDAVLLHLGRGTATAGTLTVKLRKNAVDQQSVTINITDLPVSRTWLLFKLPATVTGAGTNDYTVQLVGAGLSGSANYYYLSTATNMARALRTTTTATPNAADDLYIVGELETNKTFTANSSSGSNVLTNVSSTTGLYVGQVLTHSNTWSTTTTTITAIDAGASTVTTAANAVQANTGATYSGGGIGSDITITMDQIEGNTSVYERTFTGDVTSGASSIQSPSSTVGLALGNPLSGSGLASNAVVGGISGFIAINGAANTGTFSGQTYTAKTGYGAIHIGKRGILEFGSSASTNYLLRMFGDLNVWGDGILNIGTVATPIPRTSTAVLELGPATDGGYGLIVNDGATVSMQGLSRTSGKNVDRCKLQGGYGTGTNMGFTATFTSGSPTMTAVAAGTPGINPFSLIAVGDAIGNIAGNTGTIPAGAKIASFDSGAGTITMDVNAASTGQNVGVIATNGAFIGSKLLTVDTDTGWLSGDHIALASTSRTAADCEVGKLTANASATQLAADGWVVAATGQVLPLTGTGGLTKGHDGISPVAAEVILLTRNVKVRSISPTLMTYVFLAALATCDFDWVEFYYMGEAAANKRSLEILSGTTANPKNIQYCAIHDCEDYGATFSNSPNTSLNLIFSNNVMWNCASSTGPAINFGGAVTNNDWTIHNNIVMRTLSGNCITLADIGGTFTDNVAVGAASTGIHFTESSAVFGTVSGNIAHSNATGFNFTSGQSGVVADCTSWRNNGAGISMAAFAGLHFDGGVLFGNSSQNIAPNTAGGEVRFSDYTLNGDSSFATATAFASSGAGAAGLYIFDNCDFGTPSGIKVAHSSNDIQFTALSGVEILLRDCIMASATEVLSQGLLSPLGYIASARHDQTAGNHKVWKRAGTIQSDTTIYRTASPSERLTPLGTAALVAFIASTTTGQVTLTANDVSQLAVGQLVYSAGASTVGIITAIDTGTKVVTIDRAAGSTSGNANFVIIPKLESGSKLIPLNAGASRQVGVWVRKQQENRLSYSDDMSTNWVPQNVTKAATSATTDPLGGTTAYKLTHNAGTNPKLFYQNTGTAGASAGTTFTYSIYAKAADTALLTIWPGDAGNGVTFDLSDGTIEANPGGLAYTMTAVGNGWYRCSVTRTITGASGYFQINLSTVLGSQGSAGAEGVYIWHPQMETGSQTSPYLANPAAANYFGVGYNGSQPRLVCKANRQLGLEEDLVLGTFGGGLGEWGMISGTTPVAAEDGAFELVVDCDGTTGWISVDDFRMAA